MKGDLRKLAKNGQSVGGIYPFVLTLVLVGVVLGIGIFVLSQVKSNITDTTASNAVNDTMAAIGGIPTWLTIIVVVAMAAIVLSLIMGAFGGRTR